MASNTTPNHDNQTRPLLRAVAPTPSNASQNVSSRRLKKRELDRKSQRQAREKTKARIAELESMVKILQHQDTSGAVANLMLQLNAIEDQRNKLAKAMREVQSILQSNQPNFSETSLQTVTTTQDTEPPENQEESACGLWGDDTLNTIYTNDPDLTGNSGETLDRLEPQLNDIGTSASVLEASISDTEFDPAVDGCLIEGSHVPETDPIVPQPESYCACTVRHNTHDGGTTKNLWRVVNENFATLVGNHSSQYAEEEYSLQEDIPVRALVEGWEAVERRRELSCSWQIVRRTDEALFSKCAPAERLAIFKYIHLMLDYNLSPTTEKYAKVPPWFLRRPSQTIPHSHAIDYFVWPGVRERFVFSQHRYCSNSFWHTFADSFRIMWPFEFRDCYTRNVETGLYKISHAFDQRISDINSWTMGPDLFNLFPELHSDIPALGSIPRGIDGNGLAELGLILDEDESQSRRSSHGASEECHSDNQVSTIIRPCHNMSVLPENFDYTIEYPRETAQGVSYFPGLSMIF